MNPNDRLRERLRAFDPATPEDLNAEQRADIARIVRKQGPAIVARARRQASAVRMAGAGIALAAAATLISVLPWSRSQDRSASVVVAPAAQPACTKDANSAPMFGADGQGRETLEFGRARAVAEPDSEVSLAEFAPCHTTFVLTRGTLTVHARDLGGGELKVRVNQQEVLVRGTLFRVESRASSLRVAVEHGRVTVHGQGRVLSTVAAAQAVVIDAQGAELSSLSPQEAEALRASTNPDVSVASEREPEPEPTKAVAEPRKVQAHEAKHAQDATPEALFDQAETRWRKGDKKAARALYRRVGTSGSQIAETAWLRLARLELAQGEAKAALAALAARKKRTGSDELAAEAAWLEVEALGAAGRYKEAEDAARRLMRVFPKSPQASAAQRMLATPEPR